jgi:hypothetical protein
MSRQTVFTAHIEEADEPQLKKAVDFNEHRFVSIERDKSTMDRFAKGHKTLRGACGYMARSVKEGDPFVPEFILDLDNDQRHELTLFAFVVPSNVEAVAVVMPSAMADEVARILEDTVSDAAFNAAKIIRQAIDRR